MRQTVMNRRFRISKIAVAVLLSLVISGCTSGLTAKGIGGPTVTRVEANELPGPEGQLGDAQGYDYQIGPYDKLVVDVFGIEQLADRRITVDGAGDITLPVAGVVRLNNLSIGEASDKIAQQLRAGYVRDPRVAVNLEESVSRFVTVDGEVQQSGNYPLIAGMTLMRAVAAARGTTEFARLREVVIHRKVNGRQMIALYDLAAIRSGAYADPVLYPNDIIVVGNSPGRRLMQQLIAVAPLLVSPLVAVLDNNGN